jgi:23S rRNA pseudouridine1911/1915/1917 synthase
MSTDNSSERVVVIPSGQLWGRADKVLAACVDDISRSQLQKLFAAGRVWREEEALSQKDKVQGGDVLTFSIPELEPLPLRAVELPLSVLFEDEEIIVINKAPGMVVHPGNGTGEDTLVHALLHHCRGQLSGIGGSERPGIVHRLDKDTSGVMVAAKSNRAYQELARQFAQRETGKSYLALVAGKLPADRGEIKDPIGRHPVHRTRMAVRRNGREAHSEFQVLEASGAGHYLVQVKIFTGRTHQIRVHLAHLGAPLVGDLLYGYKPGKLALPHARVMLHSAELELKHPVTETIMKFQAELPHDFKENRDYISNQ